MAKYAGLIKFAVGAFLLVKGVEIVVAYGAAKSTEAMGA